MTIITDTRQGCTNVYMYTPACTKTTLANSKSPGKYCKTSIAGESTDAEGGVHVHPVHPPRVPNGQSTPRGNTGRDCRKLGVSGP